METLPKKEKIYLIIFWSLIGIPFLTIFFLLALISFDAFGPMPSFEELENPKSKLASEIISSDQQQLGKYYKEENRTIVNFDDISSNLVNALVATEDIRFYDHSGIDGRGLLRVLFRTLMLGQESKGGGSTITQQLAKNLFPRDTISNRSKFVKLTFTAVAKLKEWITAIKLERNYTKDEILVMYLNTVPFGSNAFGIKSASRTYFSKDPNMLTLGEAATLIGMLKAPSYYSPRNHPERSRLRRNTVINQIQKYQKSLTKLTGFKKSTPQQFDSIRALPIKLSYRAQAHNEGLATYFREFLRIMMTAKKPEKSKYTDIRSYMEDSLEWENNALYGWCNKNFKPDGTPYDLYRDGIKIYTTINSKMQKYAEEAVSEHLGLSKESLQKEFDLDLKKRKRNPFSADLSDKQIKDIMWSSIRRSERYRVLKSTGLDSAEIMKNFNTKTEMSVFSWKSGEIDTLLTPYDSILYYKRFLRAGFMAMEPQSGFVKAYVGGINFNHFKFDHVMLSKRQVGSTFKPFIYTMAMMPGGFSPCYKIPNIAVTFDMPKGQKPPTYTPQYSGSKLDGQMIPIKVGLALSLNQISAWIMKQYNPNAVVELAHKMGIKSYLDPVYSLCVGSAEVKLAEMVSAYDTYPNKGVFVEPLFVTRIEDKNGNVISTFKAKKVEVLSEGTAYRMVYMMQGVVDGGTSSRIRYKYGMKNEMAGKTGTTNNQSDGWFIGFVPNLVAGGWVGGEERSIRFSTTALGQGSTVALPIWALFFQKVYADGTLGVSKANFEKPDNDDGIELDCGKYEQGNNSNLYNEEEIY